MGTQQLRRNRYQQHKLNLKGNTMKSQIIRIIGSLAIISAIWFWSPLAAVILATIWGMCGEYTAYMAGQAMEQIAKTLELKNSPSKIVSAGVRGYPE